MIFPPRSIPPLSNKRLTRGVSVFMQLDEELRSTSARADTMNGVVAALPSDENDTVRMRAYNWQDVQDLQEVPSLY